MVLSLGPYIGDWEYEIMVFRPYVKWVSEIIECDNIFLSTHDNRAFLYDWIDDDKIWSEYKDITRDELNQKGCIYKDFKPKDFNLIVKQFKKYIQSVIHDKIENHFLKYSKNKNHCPIYNKVFSPIKTPQDVNIKEEDYIVFIPDESLNEDVIKNIYDNLIKQFSNIKVIGDMKSYLSDENMILKNVDYFENGYKYIVKYIMNANAVICPISHWTFLCNLQQKPVFSWGNNVGLYANDGIYNFNNNCFTVPTNDVNMIVDSFKYFYERINYAVK